MSTTRPELRGRHGMVASTHWLASAAGMSMLERGGNAADAAVAAAFVLQVVEPHLNGPGGEVPILVAPPGAALPEVICGQGTAPRLATPDRFAAMGIGEIPGSGLLAACVPGAFDAWMLLLARHGTLEPAEVLAPAIDYAVNGYPLLPRISAAIANVERLFREEWTTSAEVYLRGGVVPAPGTLFTNPVLAETLSRLAASPGSDRGARIEAARRAFAEGFVAAAIDRFCQERQVLDSTGQRHAALLRGDDMASWRASVERPVTLEHAGYTVCKCGPWSQGPVLLQQLAMLRERGVDALEPGGAEWMHTVVEVAKLAFADRDAWYGDPAHADVPLGDLLSDGYAGERAALVGDVASDRFRPGSPGGRTPPQVPFRGATAATDATGGEPTFGRHGVVRGDTCHVDVADRDGMLVSATPSGGWLQSSPVIPELGFCLGTRAQMFWLRPGPASSLRPGARPRTTLSPTLLLRDGAPAIAMGTPGGDQQDQWQLTVLLRLLHAGVDDLQRCIDAPQLHTTHLVSSFAPRELDPGGLAIETSAGETVLDDLRRRGHRVHAQPPWSLGRVTAVARDGDGMLRAGADPRGMQAYAAGR